MMEKKENLIFVPKELLEEESEVSLKIGTLMAFCWIRRFGSIDGHFYGNISYIMERYGLHYDKSKTKKIPKQMELFIKGLDNLQKMGVIKLESGDYHDINSYFSLFITSFPFKKNYVSLEYKYFDYILDVKKRISKMGMLYILLFALSHYTCKEKTNGKKEWYRACGYSLDWIARKTGISLLSVYTYLKNLSVEEGYDGNAPLIKSRAWCIDINGRIIRFPNIYVENKVNYEEVIELKRDSIYQRFSTGEINLNIGYIADDELDELFNTNISDENFDVSEFY